ncbi:hypothetical protein CYMTET_13273 [Cymbomonas tetramitiformis]|uniref:Uncharacterized protein n=1 Tax=Cymbomonas tetramitiformis TaxID=36881 RepID=A0AAE0GIH1_9CHLO|nr:hypothetical protein CYMTET_13273 [Cymbomonas tetramitiformis]
MQHRQRDYNSEDGFALPRQQAEAHPLRAVAAASDFGDASGQNVPDNIPNPLQDNIRSQSVAKDRSPSIVDPLGAFVDPLGASTKISDPLGAKSESSSGRESSAEVKEGTELDCALEDWDVKKAYILQRFVATGSIRVSSTFDILSRDLKTRGRSSTAARLEQLQNPEKEALEDKKMVDMQEYVTRLRELNDEIAYAWLNNERVTALKTATKVPDPERSGFQQSATVPSHQGARWLGDGLLAGARWLGGIWWPELADKAAVAMLLADTSVPQFYPTLFVLVTEVMDTVGRLVYDRIYGKVWFPTPYSTA